MNPAQREKSILLRAWILSGLFFMALPGTLLGFSNLMAISTHHGMGSLPAAWMEGHGHAQMFSWIGSFILGIGFYSQPALHLSAIRLQQTCRSLWVIGVALRWFANIYSWNWRLLFPISAGFELVAVFLFLYAASHHKLPEAVAGKTAKAPMELWMVSVLLERPGCRSGNLQLRRVFAAGDSRHDALLSARARSEVPCVAWLGISCARGLGLLRTLAANISFDPKARWPNLQSRVGTQSCRRGLRPDWMEQASDHFSCLERMYRWTRAAPQNLFKN